jgi:hypothetical protein
MIAAAPGRAEAPTAAIASELAAWRPEHGLVTVCIDADPADRGRGWRIELRNALRRIADAPSDRPRQAQLALEATIARIEERLAEELTEAPGRSAIGFVEARGKPGGERWYAATLPLPVTGARYGAGPWLGPLIGLLDRGAPLGVVAVSADRIRLMHWSLGRVEALSALELTERSETWRERKAPRPRDPAAAQAVSSAGHDRFARRLEANRERFAQQAGTLARADAAKRGWRELLAFGDERYLRPFATGFAEACPLRHVDASDLAAQSAQLIERRVEALLPDLRRERQRDLVERAGELAFTEARSSLGAEETIQALEQGRVEHLLYDPRLLAEARVERMLALALDSGAAITPVDEAVALGERGGAAAVLRY